MIARRSFINGATMAFVTVWGIVGPSSAHEGHSNLAIDANVIRATRTPDGVEVIVELKSREEADVTLYGLQSQGMEVIADMPLTMPAGSMQTLRATLIGATPNLFSLLLDFGPHGSGPVLVIVEG
ncbi:putative periplasmic lipoprotein [Cochlodiniinecator piscidefendens]|uniref:hypothetical protein n=1 Tax=Cochlodiniinecator piscidefendens TaxID=2715756 RepID=UPI00140E174A|nr:hypothetical protein [Cochlodiniinecator piscidefendens]